MCGLSSFIIGKRHEGGSWDGMEHARWKKIGMEMNNFKANADGTDGKRGEGTRADEYNNG